MYLTYLFIRGQLFLHSYNSKRVQTMTNIPKIFSRYLFYVKVTRFGSTKPQKYSNYFLKRIIFHSYYCYQSNLCWKFNLVCIHH
jgi:hypothetical protein